ncbi:MAG: glutamate-5-semialdehyde dehydrogenase [Opitutales bacterium]
MSEFSILDMAKKAKEASYEVANLSSEKKNEVLAKIAQVLIEKQGEILAQNAIDIENAKTAGLTMAMIDRLTLSASSIEKIAQGVKEVAQLPDPVGEILSEQTHPNGMTIQKVSVAIGVVGIIYESRPNVTIDCAVLCLKSGNVSILRGGKEAFYTNTIFAKIIAEALRLCGVTEYAIQLIPTTDRKALNELLKLNDYVHCIIPRGGEGLIRFVCENSNIPVIKHYKGLCNLYIDKEASLEMAKDIALNAKCQRAGVCNAIENLVLHKDITQDFLPLVAQGFVASNVEMRCDEISKTILNDKGFATTDATQEDFYTEYTDYIISIKVVDSFEEALSFVNEHSSSHSDSIVTENVENAQAFLNQIDSSCVYWNASTRFTDGYEFGLGAEIGISTDRLHARGPMGLKELCTYKYKITGTGQVRK